MEINRSVRNQLFAQGSLAVALLLALVALLSWVAREYRVETDITANARNTLTQATQDALKVFNGPVNITAYAVAKDGGGNDIHKMIQEKLRPWQRVKPDIVLTLVDPRDDPKRANAAGLKSPNELVIEHQGRSEHLPLAELNEQSLVNALTRLARTGNALVYGLMATANASLMASPITTTANSAASCRCVATRRPALTWPSRRKCHDRLRC